MRQEDDKVVLVKMWQEWFMGPMGLLRGLRRV
jgi:hypothetical protein